MPYRLKRLSRKDGPSRHFLRVVLRHRGGIDVFHYQGGKKTVVH